VFSAPGPATTDTAAIQDTADLAANRLVVFSAPSPATTDTAAVQDTDRAAAFGVRFTPPA
jgi:hypothetical protein